MGLLDGPWHSLCLRAMERRPLFPTRFEGKFIDVGLRRARCLPLDQIPKLAVGMPSKMASKTSIVGSEKSPLQIPFPLPDRSDPLINRKLLGGSARSTLGARLLDKLIDWRSLFRFGASFEGKTTGEK